MVARLPPGPPQWPRAIRPQNLPGRIPGLLHLSHLQQRQGVTIQSKSKALNPRSFLLIHMHPAGPLLLRPHRLPQTFWLQMMARPWDSTMPSEMLFPLRAVVLHGHSLWMLFRIDPLSLLQKKSCGEGKQGCSTDPSQPKWCGLIQSKTTAHYQLWCLLHQLGQGSPRGGSPCRHRAALLLTQKLLLPRRPTSGSRSRACSSHPRRCCRTMKTTRCLSCLPSPGASLHPSHPHRHPFFLLSWALALLWTAQRNSHLLLRDMGQLETNPPGSQRRTKRGKGELSRRVSGIAGPYTVRYAGLQLNVTDLHSSACHHNPPAAAGWAGSLRRIARITRGEGQTDRLAAARLCWLPRALLNDVAGAGQKARRQKVLWSISRCTDRCLAGKAKRVMSEEIPWSRSPCSSLEGFSGVASHSLQHEELKWLLTPSSHCVLRENYENLSFSKLLDFPEYILDLAWNNPVMKQWTRAKKWQHKYVTVTLYSEFFLKDGILGWVPSWFNSAQLPLLPRKEEGSFCQRRIWPGLFQQKKGKSSVDCSCWHSKVLGFNVPIPWAENKLTCHLLVLWWNDRTAASRLRAQSASGTRSFIVWAFLCWNAKTEMSERERKHICLRPSSSVHRNPVW